MRERYSIEVTDEFVDIYGELTIEETFDYLSFFERKGYKAVVIGADNSTLRMMQKDQKEEIINEKVTELKDEVTQYKRWLEREQTYHEQTKDKLKQCEMLLKTLMSKEYEKYQKSHEEIQKIIIEQGGSLPPACDPAGTKVPYPFDWTYPKQENIPLQETTNE